eukprot:CAMPEP_0203774844 /NCGR_PEP_ID=MMETSP0099_2-20121227/5638_1 /ASSEMBLY_ACC=CAM_ASM_000209 /TAXON_ID=96639 /ORGANISM=" , Strain NY0313808BC1" /LENGTH=247 /DNA_ID=CAMNT_0050673229 /DNA_START=84 /DNA_END=827 /DNA_ORIENTATION=+
MTFTSYRIHFKAREHQAKNLKINNPIKEKILNQIENSVRQNGDDTLTNRTLHDLLIQARKHEIPKENVEKAITNGKGEPARGAMHEGLLEGVGPAGSLFIVKILTDNHDKTVANVRGIFSKFGGRIDANVAHFAFDKEGYFEVEVDHPENGIATVVDNGAIRAVVAEHEMRGTGKYLLQCYTLPEQLHETCEKLRKKEGFTPVHEELIYTPKETMETDAPTHLGELNELANALENDIDVVRVFHTLA